MSQLDKLNSDRVDFQSSSSLPQISQPAKKGSITSHVAGWLKSIVYPVARYGLLPFYFSRIEVTGQENLPPEGAVILAPTHRARWDAFVVPYATGPYITGRDPTVYGFRQ